MGTQNLLTAGMERWEWGGSELPVTKELKLARAHAFRV